MNDINGKMTLVTKWHLWKHN